MGAIRLWQGAVPGSPTIVLSGGPPPAIDLNVGPPAAGAAIHADTTGIALKFGPTTSIELGADGITLKYAAFSVKMNAQGIQLNAGPSQLKLGPDSASLNGIITEIEGKALALTSKLPMKVNG
jgi:hypothetical protein